MVQQFSRPIAARRIEARARAKQRGVRVEVVVAERHYTTRSQSQTDVSYNLDRTSDGWTCECLGYEFTGCCKHIAAVERRSEREGWRFGRVAPVKRAA